MRDTKQDILHFWFSETEPVQWFQKNPDFDQSIRERFRLTYTMARDGVCDHWASDADGCLALCLVLDQFPRNMFRDSAEAFATDEKALKTARLGIIRGFDQILPVIKRRFVYLPFEHSEAMDDQNRAVELFATMRDDDPLGYEYALRHRDVIERFGRFPHRNAVLGRDNTAEELIYLSQPGAGF
ncbi:DUF924 family protein [Micavibrio aeruginosavorus]|uniref:DUF924 family protein n=1 Tax=Micavibrio aeruginosavorus TaxID=349221 RepID=UPI003F4A9648